MRRIALALGLALLSVLPAIASWRDDIKVIKVGFLAGENPAYEVTRMEPFRSRLQYGLAVPVELFPARSYQALIEAEASGRIQYAILSSLAYVALDQDCHCAEPLVQPTAANGARGFRTMLMVRADGPIADLEGAKGTRLAIGAKDSISGRIAPYSGLAEQGIEPEGYFARTFETENALSALTALVDGEADVSVAWSTASDPASAEPGSGPIADLAEQRGGSMPALKSIWTSGVIPFGPHAIRTDLPPEARAAILDTLLSMKSAWPDAYDAAERQSGGFVAADPDLYRHFSNLLASVAQPQ
ncbi:hypothetical protein C3941_18680 [Kaistia algarum]|uniref:phosphate/phosphite/phosphonate ABC transporter substrate-binding protein n=1 Tax=Kaistia algarum TaxID=2083279 RepID=UPI000CE8D30B|nr:phosphate/phosphite/phosphonate ABC transporter substrate-binding protein [Kaistia algarum]MCX5516530.1 phosphate/phosphite/phosphonate ABC transporter substrate-binding protein [Kaistia algarum]PPE78356.1 hypothetical protein C3941_18680 [Kaistia algarum]